MATDWEDQYQRKDTPWEKGAPSPGLVEFLRSNTVKGSVLVPGCGFGHDVRALAAHGAEVVGLDIAPSAVAAAKAVPAVNRERYEAADLFALPEHLRGAFDWVWEHTCFCAIDLARRPDYARGVAEALRGGGQFLGIFYLDPGQALRESGPPFETTLMELDRLFLPYFDLVQEWVPRTAYPGRERREWMRLLRKR